VQADASALPIRSQSVATLLCHGAYHVFPETAQIVSEWRRVLEPRGSLFVSSLVRGRWIGDRYLGALHRAGEVAEPRSPGQFAAALKAECGRPIRCEAIGSFAYART
jgi:SAM-dependent methyltransferase